MSVAILFYKLADLADLVGSTDECGEYLATLESGKLFLLELLSSAVIIFCGVHFKFEILTLTSKKNFKELFAFYTVLLYGWIKFLSSFP